MQVFASEYTYVMVNRKPVLPYHLLVVPKLTSSKRLKDLNCQENAGTGNLQKTVIAPKYEVSI